MNTYNEIKRTSVVGSLLKQQSPLRAKVSLGFTQYISPSTVKKLDQQASPDVTHMVDVVEGVSLPQLCQKVWNDDSFYVQVAQYNDLNKFRDLKGIQSLIFPPIIQRL